MSIINQSAKPVRDKKVVLAILDGWGMAPVWGGNAISAAHTPNFHYFWNRFSHSRLSASGQAVGLPGHEMGNSEVGHLTIGAGRIISQDDSRINREISTRSFFHNHVLGEFFDDAVKRRAPVHLVGLLGAGKVHSDLNHLFALLDFCRLKQVNQVFLHLFTDGRDSPPRSALELLEKLENKLQQVGCGEIASIAGRFYAMDRDNHWDRTRRYFEMITRGAGATAVSPRQAVSQAYRLNQSDEFIQPTNILKNHQPIGLVKPFSRVIFFNFRKDRARQLLRLLAFEVAGIKLVTFVPYQSYDLPRHVEVCFQMPPIKHYLAEVVSRAGKSQAHIAETEKFAHVTYFLDGGSNRTLPGEKKVLIKSFPVTTFDQYPQMRAPEISRAVIKMIKRRLDWIVFNFANADMVGHSGNLAAVIQAVEVIDNQLNQIWQTAKRAGYSLLITADHGNAEEMVNPASGEINTQHTTNLVPFIWLDSSPVELKSRGGLADVAPTVLEILGLTPPPEMTGRSLILNREK